MAKRKVFRLQVAIREVAEVEIRGCDTIEEALALVGTEAARKEFFKEHPVLGEDWECVDGNEHILGVFEMEPGWSIVER